MNKLIIIPGWGGNKQTWKKFAKLASGNFDVEVIELPCFGDEPCPTTSWNVEDYTEFVKEKLKKSSLLVGERQREVSTPVSTNQVILLGHSFGGQVATVFASKYPELIDKLILSAPAVFRPKKTFRRFIFRAGAKFGRLFFRIPWIEKGSVLAENLYHKAIGAKDYHDTSGIKRETFRNIIRQDRGVEASHITTPTLILWGTMDTYLPTSDAYKLNKLIPNSKLEIIKNGRHGLHLYQPRLIIDLIKKFTD